jgi:hypothetical protein
VPKPLLFSSAPGGVEGRGGRDEQWLAESVWGKGQEELVLIVCDAWQFLMKEPRGGVSGPNGKAASTHARDGSWKQGTEQRPRLQRVYRRSLLLSWKLWGKLCWLWAAATANVAVFVIHAQRSALGLAALLGQEIDGILHSDRWHVYRHVPEERRQLCWAHLKRDFQ